MFGSIYFGQTYFAGSGSVQTTLTVCGGQYFGGVYFGQTPVCGDIVPEPEPTPEPPPVITIGGGGILLGPSKGRRKRVQTYKPPPLNKPPKLEPPRTRPRIPRPVAPPPLFDVPPAIFVPHIPPRQPVEQFHIPEFVLPKPVDQVAVAPYDDAEAEAILTIIALL